MASYRDALVGGNGDSGRSWSSQAIMQKVLELGLDFTLDVETPGDGACFFHAVIQQLSKQALFIRLPKVRIIQW